MFIDIGDTNAFWYYTAMVAAVSIIGIAKSGFGGGIGILAVPLIANVLPAQAALGVMLPILIGADVLAVWQHLGRQSWKHVRWTFSGATIGIAAGTALIFWFQSGSTDHEIQEAWLSACLRLLVGGICLGMVLLQCYRLLGGRVPRLPDTRNAGISTGGIAGFISMLTHGAGPIMSIYFLEHKMEKRLLVGTLAFFFFVVNLSKVPSYVGLGWINSSTLSESAVWLLAVPIGSLIGFWLHKRIPAKPFTLVMYLGAGVAAASMIHKAISTWPA